MKILTLLASAALLTSLGMTAYAIAPSLSASSIHMSYIQNATASSSATAPTSSTPSGATSNSNDDSSATGSDDSSDDGSDDTAGDNDGDN